MSDYEGYGCGAYLTGALVFFLCWGYAIATYGWFLGLGLGWIPALFIGAIAGLLWPLLLLAILALAFLIWKGR